MTAYTGTVQNIGSKFLLGPWKPIVGIHNWRTIADSYHNFRIYVAELRDEYAAGDLSNSDTITWTIGTLGGSEVLVGAYLIHPRDIDGDANDYNTYQVKIGSTAVCSVTKYGVEAGVPQEISRAGNATARAGSRGDFLYLVCTATVASSSEAVQAGTLCVIVTKTC